MILKRKTVRYLKHNKYIYFLILTSICAGVIAGSFGGMRAENIQIIQRSQMNNNQIIMSSFLENMKYLTWIALWGLNAVGIPVVIYLLYTKGAYVCAAVYSVLLLESANKFIAVISAVPYIVCTISGAILISQASIECSLCTCKTIIFNKSLRKGQVPVLKLAICFALACVTAFLGGMAETLLKVNIT